MTYLLIRAEPIDILEEGHPVITSVKFQQHWSNGSGEEVIKGIPTYKSYMGII